MTRRIFLIKILIQLTNIGERANSVLNRSKTLKMKWLHLVVVCQYLIKELFLVIKNKPDSKT